MPVKLILKSSCRPLLTPTTAKKHEPIFFSLVCGFQLSIKIVAGFDFDFCCRKLSVIDENSGLYIGFVRFQKSRELFPCDFHSQPFEIFLLSFSRSPRAFENNS